MICDAHVHFFSPAFFATLAAQRQVAGADAIRHLGWDDPGSPDALADRWSAELDRHGVSRAALIASVPGDEDSVAAAIARHPSRFAGSFMLDPTREDAESRVMAALARGLRGVCLFPAMHRYSLHDECVARVVEVLATFSPTGARPFNSGEGGPRPYPDGPAPGEARGPTGAQRRRHPEVPTGEAGPARPPGGPHPQGPTARRAPPVLFVHCGVLSVGARAKLGLPSPFDLSRGHPLNLHALAVRHPSLLIVIPHFGAGLLREALMLADVCPNVLFDTSSSNRWIRYTPGLTLEAVFETALAILGPSRLLFGTDSSFFPRGWTREVYDRQRAALDAVGAAPDAQAQIFGGNFERIFG
jgi:predicted TIM-barrel fold metal-dependent hydrolase